MSLFRAPKDKNYEVLFTENSFITDLQIVVESAMHAKGISQADLAKRIGVSEARVSQILSGNGANLEARTIARIAYALDLEPVVQFVERAVQANPKNVKADKKLPSIFQQCALAVSHPAGMAWGKMAACNDDCLAEAV